MPRSKKLAASRDPLPSNFPSLTEFWAFGDTHSSADYENLMDDVTADIDIQSSKIYCAVAKEIVDKLRAQADRQGVSTATLVNLWLQEKVVEAARG